MDSAASLLEQPLSQFVQAAVIEAAHRLGFYAGVTEVKAQFRGKWPDLPDRGEEATDEHSRTSLTFDPQTAELLERASEFVKVGKSLFILGATFRYLANLRRTEPRLKTLKLPPQYEHP